MNDDALDWITDVLLDRGARGETSPSATLFLLRRYAATGRADVRDAVEVGLAKGLDRAGGEPDPRQRCQWLGVFADAAVISDDERLPLAVQELLSPTIDDLEGLVRASYEPGEGMLGATSLDQFRAASALLTAFELTGRLPYSMLAEELVQVTRRQMWDEARGVFRADFDVNCGAVHVLCQLAALHRDPEYTSSAIVADHATYLRDAGRALAALQPVYREHPTAAAEYGVALLDWFALSEHPN